MRRTASLLLLLLVAAPLAAQQLGSIVFPTSGKPEAQGAFLRGVAALHSFWYDEAADAFREAEAQDPDFALAYWGEAMTYNHPIWMEVDVDAGRKALAKLGDRKPPTARERGYLDAVRVLFGEGEKRARDVAYEQAMEHLAAANTTDAEAQAFHALSILGTKAPDETDGRKQIRAAAILEPLYAANPDHPGVLHYLIHAYDDPLHAPLGLRAAQRYAKVAPAAFHALHMPSHIFLQLGMWNETVASNEQSYAVSKQWVERKKLPRTKQDLHSLQWLEYAYLQQKRFDDARKLFAEIEPAAGEDARERTTRAMLQARYAVESGDWTVLPPITAAAPAKEEAPHAGCAMKSYANDSSLLMFAQGLAAVSRGDAAAAKLALAQLATSRAEKKDLMKRTIDVMAKELEASLEWSAGASERALDLAHEAVALEDRLGAPTGPPDMLKPALELYGELLLKAGNRTLAAEQFRLSLLRTPNRRLSVEGAAKAGPPMTIAVSDAVGAAP